MRTPTTSRNSRVSCTRVLPLKKVEKREKARRSLHLRSFHFLSVSFTDTFSAGLVSLLYVFPHHRVGLKEESVGHGGFVPKTSRRPARATSLKINSVKEPTDIRGASRGFDGASLFSRALPLHIRLPIIDRPAAISPRFSSAAHRRNSQPLHRVSIGDLTHRKLRRETFGPPKQFHSLERVVFHQVDTSAKSANRCNVVRKHNDGARRHFVKSKFREVYRRISGASRGFDGAKVETFCLSGISGSPLVTLNYSYIALGKLSRHRPRFITTSASSRAFRAEERTIRR